MIYYGNEWGYTFGTRPADDNPSTSSRSAYGFPRSAPLSQVADFRCIGRDLASAGCDAVDCGTADSVHCAATCEIANTTNCYGDGDELSIVYYNSDWGTFAPPSGESVQVEFTYDPRQRPWYKAALNSDEPVWTAPYAWSGEVGFTQAVAIVDPVTGAKHGALGIDYHLAHMYEVLVLARPTPHSDIYLCSLDGYLYAASRLSKEVIRSTWDSARGRTRYHLDNVLVHHNPAVNSVFNSIVGRVGSLNEASQVRRLLQMPDSTLLVSPLNVTGGLNMIVVIEVPHGDILDVVNDASSLSLGFVIVFSVVLAGLVSGAIYLLVSSIETVSRDMHNVAWMRVDSTQVARRGSVVREIRSMQDSFRLLVCNMIEYRQYLPQSLLTDSVSKDDGGEDDAEESVKGSALSASAISAARSQSGLGSSDHKNSSDAALPRHEARHRTIFDNALGEGPVSVVSCNWRGTHERLAAAQTGSHFHAFSEKYSSYLESVMQAAKHTRGVVDNVSGDRVCVTFNAVTHAVMHIRKAVDCALLVRASVGEQGAAAVTGVATGNGVCGNAGCQGLKKHCVFGKAVTVAHALVRLARSLEETIVAEGAVADAVKPFYFLKRLQNVLISCNDKPSVVCAVISVVPASGKNEEWMYEMEAAEKKNPYSEYNLAMNEMHSGNFDAAAEIIDKSAFGTESGDASALKKRILACKKEGGLETPAVFC
eukprot:Rhum_TRINITY_DN8379_c0_g2::Rhum_TRINITY_DN8379_c0_g2_i1::g.27544::m.27544